VTTPRLHAATGGRVIHRSGLLGRNRGTPRIAPSSRDSLTLPILMLALVADC
jgi:hypothetical protein